MSSQIVKMNPELKEAFSKIKPICDLVMVKPSAKTITAFTDKLASIKKEVVQDLQQYMLFPFITHIKSNEIDKKFDLQSKMADAMCLVLEKVTVHSFDMCLQIQSGLLALVFDNSKPGMVAVVPEELKLSITRCLTTLMLSLEQPVRMKLLKTQVPLIAQAVFVCVHIAKLEKLKSLRLSALECIKAHTATHEKLTDDNYHIVDEELEVQVVDSLASILPGMMAALQDVAAGTDNPGHDTITSALDAIHRILCITLQDKYAPKQARELTVKDFAVKVWEKMHPTEASLKKPKNLVKRSPEWYEMAGEKLTVVTRSLAGIATHEHPGVRKELAVLFARIINECAITMQPSIPTALEILIALTKDDIPEMQQFCNGAIDRYFSAASPSQRFQALDNLSDNFFDALNRLPSVLNSVEPARKVGTLNLIDGYLSVMCDEGRPQRLTSALGSHGHMAIVLNALIAAAQISPIVCMAEYATRDPTMPPPTGSPWCRLHHLEHPSSERQLQSICRQLGGAECAELIADRLLEMFVQHRDPEVAYIMNYMTSSPNSPYSLVKRILDLYVEEDMWNLPLEVTHAEPPISSDETYDVNVYNPRAWTKDSVPDLYEGAVETRYTDISYLTPRAEPLTDPNGCASISVARRNMVMSCILTEGIAIMATRLQADFQHFLMKTLCLILERVATRYGMLHLAGLRAIHNIAAACGFASVAELIKDNFDYLTEQVTKRLKRPWSSKSALEILTVVMEYSDVSIFDCLYGIVEDVLVQSCDKYHQRDLESYLQVFLTLIQCIAKWFPRPPKDRPHSHLPPDLFEFAVELHNYRVEEERLASNEEMERESGKTVEEMYKEDLKKREEDLLDYDDKVSDEKSPVPQHIKVTLSILNRCVHFIASPNRQLSLLAIQTLDVGMPIITEYEDELLPLVHRVWAPLVGQIVKGDLVLTRRGVDLLVTLAELAKDFIRLRAIKEVLPYLYRLLHKLSLESLLKDAGSAYRHSLAYEFQARALEALPGLAISLGLREVALEEVMLCAEPYLSRNQPRQLQEFAVATFQRLLNYDRGATWHYLRLLCNNRDVIQPPELPLNFTDLEPIVGTPYNPTNKDYEHSLKVIFNLE